MERPELETVGGIVAALYRTVSFAPGDEPTWDEFRQLFAPGARLVPPRGTPLSEPETLDLDAFVDRSTHNLRRTALGASGFWERETSRRVFQFGDVVHVASAYVARHVADGPEIGAGVNSIQIVRGATRLWIVSLVWDQARPGLTVPVFSDD